VDTLAQWGFPPGVERGPDCICPDGPACPCIHTDAEGYERRRLFQRPGPRLLAAPADEEVCPVCGWGGGRGAGTCELTGVWLFVSVNEWEGVWRREGRGELSEGRSSRSFSISLTPISKTPDFLQIFRRFRAWFFSSEMGVGNGRGHLRRHFTA